MVDTHTYPHTNQSNVRNDPGQPDVMSEAKLTKSTDVIDQGSSLSPLCEITTDKLGTTPVLSTEETFGLDLKFWLEEPTNESQACGEDQWEYS